MTLFWGLSGSYGVILGENMNFFKQKAHFEAVMDQELAFFMKYAAYNYLIQTCPIDLPYWHL